MVKAAHNEWATGKERRRLYATWSSMHARCSDASRPDYARYGGRGITVCESWSSFAQFLSDMGPRPAGHSLDRVDGSLGYSPTNCRWATRMEQQRNRRNNRLLDWNGQTKCLAEWAEVTGLTREVIRDRLDHLGWSVEAALITPMYEHVKTERCRNGHPRIEANVSRSSGRLVCLACNREAVARYKKRTGEQA